MYQYQIIVRGEIGSSRNFLYTKQFFARVIFEEPPLTIHGVCVATSIAGVGRHFFKIKLLRYLEYWRSNKVKHFFAYSA